jgi:hypothetical protein
VGESRNSTANRGWAWAIMMGDPPLAGRSSGGQVDELGELRGQLAQLDQHLGLGADRGVRGCAEQPRVQVRRWGEREPVLGVVPAGQRGRSEPPHTPPDSGPGSRRNSFRRQHVRLDLVAVG